MTQTIQRDVASIVDAILENAKCFPEFNPEIRNVTTREPVRQGDVYFIPYTKKLTGLKKMTGDNVFELTETTNGQGIRLVPKTPGETQGSNHILVLSGEVEVYYPPNFNTEGLFGPIFTVPQEESASVVHPEHAGLNFRGEACGAWQVGYQEDTIRQQRTAD